MNHLSLFLLEVGFAITSVDANSSKTSNMFAGYVILVTFLLSITFGECSYEVREYESPPFRPNWIRPKNFKQPPVKTNYSTARWLTPKTTTESSFPEGPPPARPGSKPQPQVKPPKSPGKPNAPLRTTPRPNQKVRTTPRKSAPLRVTTERITTARRPWKRSLLRLPIEFPKEHANMPPSDYIIY